MINSISIHGFRGIHELDIPSLKRVNLVVGDNNCGKTSFGRFFRQNIENPMQDSGAFEKVAVITDRDNREIATIQEDISRSLDNYFPNMENNRWMTNDFQDAFGMEMQRQFLLLIIPAEHEGALETVMLDAISEDPYDCNIVERCKRFVSEIRPEASLYIANDRLRLKSELGVTWAIQFPEKVFSLIDEEIKSVPWESYDTLRRCFRLLEDL